MIRSTTGLSLPASSAAKTSISWSAISGQTRAALIRTATVGFTDCSTLLLISAALGSPLTRDASSPDRARLDRLAAEGASFTRAYCPCPVCVPARNSLIHGVWPSRHGVIATLPPDLALAITEHVGSD